MNAWSKITLLALVTATLVATSCRKIEEFPPEPEIEFVDFLQFGADSAQLIFAFTDGDGDIGLRDKDTIAPYDYNVFLTYYEMENGVWITPVLSTPFWYRVPMLRDRDSDKALQGDINVDLSPFYARPGADTIRYDVVLRDRALNESNRITTPNILVP